MGISSSPARDILRSTTTLRSTGTAACVLTSPSSPSPSPSAPTASYRDPDFFSAAAASASSFWLGSRAVARKPTPHSSADTTVGSRYGFCTKHKQALCHTHPCGSSCCRDGLAFFNSHLHKHRVRGNERRRECPLWMRQQPARRRSRDERKPPGGIDHAHRSRHLILGAYIRYHPVIILQLSEMFTDIKLWWSWDLVAYTLETMNVQLHSPCRNRRNTDSQKFWEIPKRSDAMATITIEIRSGSFPLKHKQSLRILDIKLRAWIAVCQSRP